MKRMWSFSKKDGAQRCDWLSAAEDGFMKHSILSRICELRHILLRMSKCKARPHSAHFVLGNTYGRIVGEKPCCDMLPSLPVFATDVCVVHVHYIYSVASLYITLLSYCILITESVFFALTHYSGSVRGGVSILSCLQSPGATHSFLEIPCDWYR